ncbi:hypothetical protein SAMN04515674_10896 [Pseudarcicella hirudinis]|uniref:Glycoside hydrolase family 5 domain-containing protein n=1 Tax=Pseudarcicella hirudinis TaxID=1079859 RepID=A0A1I5UX28_9BACT|nr:cellulase family glycosylhydrolase [Pseudarcicella hirudinis]SFP99752.1 hypothetical protein SAMN04515674_10896 [Pseudarcicella hirudinis]
MKKKYLFQAISTMACVSLMCAFVPVFTGCSDKSSSVQPETKTQVEGVFGNGVNLQPSYYNSGNADLGWRYMTSGNSFNFDTGNKIKTVRIEIEPGQETNAKRWISEAKTAGKTIICTYHKASVLGSDDANELTAAANWWKNNYSSLGGGFTINLMNEWGSHNLTATAYANAYNNAISIVRQVYSGSIIIDIPGWGQESYVAVNAVLARGTGGVKINDTNIILSTHIYAGNWVQQRTNTSGTVTGSGWMNTADLDYLNTSGRSVIVGEFGNGTSGSADWSGLVDNAKGKGWTVLGWSWNGDGGSMNMITPQFQAYTAGSPKTYSKSSYWNTIINKL